MILRKNKKEIRTDKRDTKRKGDIILERIRKIFEGSKKNAQADAAAYIGLGLMWMPLLMPMGIVFIAIGITELVKERKK